MQPERLDAAADAFLAAALVGEGWDAALGTLAQATGDTGAVLMCYQGHRLKAAVPSAGLAEMYATFSAGGAPPCSRLSRINLCLDEGFRLDHDDYTDAELARDPFYQEFLLPRGAFWNAVAKLAAGPDDWGIELSFKRDLRAGPYDPRDRGVLDAALPQLRSAARIAQNTFDAGTSAIARLLRQRRDLVFELDAFGNVRQVSGMVADSRGQLIGTVGRRLIAADRAAQPAIDRALAAALTPPRRPVAVPLTDQNGSHSFLQIVPVVGQARDVFLATAAVAVVLQPSARPQADRLDTVLLHDAFGFTEREAAVALLLSEGISLIEIAHVLRIRVGTVRNHLKSVFEKSNTRRQAELVALLARFRI